jgi:hypothetical protein
MSREIAEKLAKESLQEARYRDLHKTGTPYDEHTFEDIIRMKVERLLADERERLLAPSPCGQQGHIANDWYSVCSAHGFYQDSCGNCKCGDCFRCKELQAGREKVREMCAEWMEHSVDKGCSGVLDECSCGLENFLQLDLTAPSSREEGEIGSRCQDCGRAYRGAVMPCPFCGSDKAQECIKLSNGWKEKGGDAK